MQTIDIADEIAQDGFVVVPVNRDSLRPWDKRPAARVANGIKKRCKAKGILTMVTWNGKDSVLQCVLVGTEEDGVWGEDIIDTASMTDWERAAVDRIRAAWAMRHP